MEIRTRRDERAEQDGAPIAVPEKSRYLRRKPVQKVRRSHWKTLARGLRLLGWFAAISAVLSGSAAVITHALSSSRFSLATVTLIGCRQTDPARLEAIVRRECPNHLLRIDLNRLRDRLEHEPWVRRADVRRVLPSQLVIQIVERTPTTVIEINGELLITDEEGILLDRYDSKYGKLDVPVIKGIRGVDARSYRVHQQENTKRVMLALGMLAELEACSPALTRNISEVDVSEPENVKVLLVDDTAEIYLGDRDFLNRFRTFMSNISQYRELQAQHQDIASVDLRYEGQIIYRPGPGPGDQNVEVPEGRQ